MIKSSHQPRRYTIIKLVSLSVVIGLVTGAIVGAGWLAANVNSSNRLNQNVTHAAEEFLISKVGSERFHQYFKLDVNKSIDSEEGSNFGSRAYHFALLKTAADDDLVVVQVNRQIVAQTFANLVPDCVKDANRCNFNTSQQQALAIARQNGLTATDIKTHWDAFHDNSNLAIEVSSCSQNKSIWIDYTDGHVTGIEDVLNCGGTP